MVDDKMPDFYGYPAPKEGPDFSYSPKPGTNPVVRGIPLVIAGSAAVNLGFVSNFLWSNAGFNSLRKLKDLEGYAPRYDPTVVPVASPGASEFGLAQINEAIAKSPTASRKECSVAEYYEAFKSGKTTPLAIVKTLLDLVAANPDHQKAFLSIKKAQVLAAAEESTSRYKDGNSLSVLDGVPVGVKDEVDLEGYEKTLGTSKSVPSPEGTSWCVKKWQEAGAIIVGKLNMHEIGLDTSNNNPVTGTPLNPHNRSYYPGGSSGGSAYAVSAGLLPIALGADGGGSIRIPSTYCGIYGLKPSHKRVSDSPTVGLAESCGVVGPMASNMADVAIAYRIMALPNPSDPRSALFSPPLPSDDLKRKVIGICKPWFDSADPAVLNACHAALAAYGSAGYEIIDINMPYLVEGQLAHAVTILSEITVGIHDLGHLTPANKILISVGQKTPAVDLLLAQKMRNLLMQHLSFLFTRYPGLLVVTPTTPNVGWPVAGGAADLKHGVSDANMSVRNMTFVWLANFTGCPAISIPVGMAEPKEGKGRIPIGLMAMAEWGAEEELIEWGKVGEQWAHGDDGEKSVSRPENYVDMLKMVGVR